MKMTRWLLALGGLALLLRREERVAARRRAGAVDAAREALRSGFADAAGAHSGATAKRGDAGRREVDTNANRGDPDANPNRGDAGANANRGDAGANAHRGDADASAKRGDTRAEARLADKITIIVTSCDRPCCIVRFLASVRRRYPRVPVRVCDNSAVPLLGDGAQVVPAIEWIHPSEGALHTVGAGRNRLLEAVQTPYFFLCDDDHVFSEGTDLARMLDFLETTGGDIAGGCQGRDDYGTAIFERDGDLAVQRFFRHRGVVDGQAVICDRVSNSFLARTDAVRRMGGWEARVYANEHAEFFYRAHLHGLRVAQLAGVWVDHDQRCEVRTGVGRLLGRWLPHPDFDYLRRRSDVNRIGVRSRRARALERRWCWEKNGVRAIVGRTAAADRRAFMAMMRRLEDDLATGRRLHDDLTTGRRLDDNLATGRRLDDNLATVRRLDDNLGTGRRLDDDLAKGRSPDDDGDAKEGGPRPGSP